MPVPGRRWRASLIIGLFFVAVGASAFIGWWYATMFQISCIKDHKVGVVFDSNKKKKA